MKRRRFLKSAAIGGVAAAPLTAATIAHGRDTFNFRMTNAYGPGAPFYTVGPGSPTDIIEKLQVMSGGRLNIQHYCGQR